MSSAFKFGVELELLLSGRFENEFSDLKQFANHVASCYNRRTGRHDRKIHEDLDGDYKGEDADKEWSLTEDCTVRADRADQFLFSSLALKSGETTSGSSSLISDRFAA
ncbi:hypothetical protein DTO271D3_4174 [Paecilomyces variotii]|nr:hypothetical protein DTO169E5_370 [Paecilomyces variotii]KAJ9315601.1 hypothetical protein DTO271D3_4174 [Paecilomyces variotii]